MKKRGFILFVALVLLLIGSGAVYAATKCNTCGGKGYRVCSPCGGTGKVRTGTVTNSKGTQITYGNCVTCRGTGKITCSSCGGDGLR